MLYTVTYKFIYHRNKLFKKRFHPSLGAWFIGPDLGKKKSYLMKKYLLNFFEIKEAMAVMHSLKVKMSVQKICQKLGNGMITKILEVGSKMKLPK